MQNKKIKPIEIKEIIKSGMTIMVSGFLGKGSPNKLLEEISKMKDIKDLTLITNDTAFDDKGVGKLIKNKQVKKVIASHIGTNKETIRQMNEGLLEVILTPQGTLVEQIRAKGAGLGGVLTPTGIGTLVEKGKEKIVIDNKEYLLEKPLSADLALVSGYKGDTFGNLTYEGSTQNFSPTMASAGDITIAEVEEIIEEGYLDPNRILTPGIFVDYIVEGGN